MADALKPKDVAAAIKANINKPDELQKLLALTRAVVPGWQALAKDGQLPAEHQNVLKLIGNRVSQIIAGQRQRIAQAQKQAQLSKRPGTGGTVKPGAYLPTAGYLTIPRPGFYLPTLATVSPKETANLAQARKARANVAARAKVAVQVAQVKTHQMKLANEAKKIQQSVRLNPTAEQAKKARDAMGKLRGHMAADAKNIIEIQRLLKGKQNKK